MTGCVNEGGLAPQDREIGNLATKLQNVLDNKFGPGAASVGHDQKSTLIVYEHRRGLKPYRKEWENSFGGNGITLEQKYIGKVLAKPAS